jgi:hypothetical protein
MNEQERAEEHLKTIRRLMERATIYRAISAPTALVGGALSLVASFLTADGIPKRTQSNDSTNFFVWFWLLVLLLTAATNTFIIVLGARRRNEPVFSASMKAAFIALAPAFIVGGVSTLGGITAGADWDPSDSFQLGVTWAMLYGVGLLATSHFAPRSLTMLGWAFLLSGVAGTFGGSLLFRISPDFPDRGVALFMALTFGLFHLIYAACAWPRKGTAPEL